MIGGIPPLSSSEHLARVQDAPGIEDLFDPSLQLELVASQDEFRERTVVVTTPHGGIGYVRKLRDLGVQVWTLPSATQRVSMAEFRKRCAQERITGVYFEGGAQLVSQILQDRQLDYLFVYRAPLLFADDRAKPMFNGLRTERLANAIRLAEVRHEALGEDVLTRGRVQYPERLHIDETTFSLG